MSSSTVIPAARTSAAAGVRQVAADYFELTKPKVQTLLLFTTITSMEIAGNPKVSKIALCCLGGYLSAGGAGAVNHYYDRDIDAQMKRTATRPIPAGRISPRAALTFGIALAALSFVLMWTTLGLLAGGAGAVRVRRLRRHLHDVAEAQHAAEHRDRRRRRCRAAAGRLGGHPRARCRGPRCTCSRSSSTGRRPTSGR